MGKNFTGKKRYPNFINQKSPYTQGHLNGSQIKSGFGRVISDQLGESPQLLRYWGKLGSSSSGLELRPAEATFRQIVAVLRET